MDKSVLRRIETLEQQKPRRVICLAKNIKTGEEREMPMRELVEKGVGVWDMVRVLSGKDLDDIDAYLNAVFEYAKRECAKRRKEGVEA